MKIIRISVILLVLLSLFSLTVSAEGEGEDILKDFEQLLPDGVSGESLEELMDGVSVEGFFGELVFALTKSTSGAVSFLMLLFGVSIFMCLSQMNIFSVSDSILHSSSVGISVISALLIFSRLFPIVRTVQDSLAEISAFFNSVTPIFSAILLSSGSVATASVQTVNMGIVYALSSAIAVKLLLPIAISLFSLSLVSSFNEGGVANVSKSLRSIFLWGLGIVSALIIGASSLQSLIATASDNAYLRTAKYAISGMIPMVGNTVTGALGTLVGGLSYVKSSVGVGSVVVIVTLALSPLLSMILYRLCLSVCIIFLEFMECKGGVQLFSAFRSSYDAVISVYAVSVVVYVLEVIIFMKGGAFVFG